MGTLVTVYITGLVVSGLWQASALIEDPDSDDVPAYAIAAALSLVWPIYLVLAFADSIRARRSLNRRYDEPNDYL